MGKKSFSGGIHPHDYKEFSRDAALEVMPTPRLVRIPLAQHIGAPAQPVVKLKDTVVAGQLIAKAGGFVSINMHASISGTVTKIAKFPHPSGSTLEAIEITADGENTWIDLADEANYLDLSGEEMKKRIQDAGVCGMGGAGFPTHVKLSPPADKPIDSIILNGVECEPFLTSDYRGMLEQADEIIAGLRICMKIVGAKKGYVGIECNKPAAIKLFEEKLKNEKDLELVSLKLRYPQGAEKQLIYACTRREVPNKGGLPMDVGVVVQNVGTAVAVYDAVRFKKPLVSRIISITGPEVVNPKNLVAPIGTLFSEMLEYCGGAKDGLAKLISGGPMMGFAISTLDTPMAKTTSGILLLDKKFAAESAEGTCLRCGRCVDVCPLKLVPSMMVNCAKYEDWEGSEKAGSMDCLKCASCAYVCPAHIKLIQWIDIAKKNIWEMKNSQKNTEK